MARFQPQVPQDQYLDPRRFPETTQAGLNYQQQRLLDSNFYDLLQQKLEDGRPLGPVQQKCLKELQEKLGPHPNQQQVPASRQ